MEGWRWLERGLTTARVEEEATAGSVQRTRSPCSWWEGEAGGGQILWGPVGAVVKGLAFILLGIGTTLINMLKCKGPNGPLWQNPLAFVMFVDFWNIQVIAASISKVSFLGFNKTPGSSTTMTFFFFFFCPVLFLNPLNMDFLKVQSLVFQSFFVLRKYTHSQIW